MEIKQTNISATDFEQLAGELLGNGNALRFRACGNSMHPFIKDGDILTITPTDSVNLKNGDIAFYRKADGKPAAHRIIGKKKITEKRLFLIRGDGYVSGPEEVPAEDIMGIVSKVERDDIELRLNSAHKKLAATTWSKTQSIRWFLYRIKRRLNN